MSWSGLPLPIAIAGELTPEERERVPPHLAGRRTLWRTLREVRYDSLWRGRVVVPAGWITDLTSIPWWLPWKRREGEHTAASVAHDKLYADGSILTANTTSDGILWLPSRITRKEADELYLEAMLSLGVGPELARMIYLGVRLGGWRPWRRYRRRQSQ